MIQRLAGACEVVAADGPASVCAPNRSRRAVCAEVGGDANGGGGLADGVAQQGGGVPGGRGLIVLAGGVQADHGVEVDDAACLVLSHLDIPDPHQGAELSG